MRIVRKFQEGGPMPAEGAPVEQAPMEGGAPAQGGQEEMMAQLQQMAAEIIQQTGPEAAAMLAQMIMEMLQGGAAPAEQGQPVFKKGGKLAKRVKKDCGGSKLAHGGKAKC